MKIAQIRDVIRGARWLRNDYAGHTAEEFRRANVAQRLEAAIAELQSLQIAPRFTQDIDRRDEEIRYCREVIARWHAAQDTAVPVLKPGHVFIGGNNCVKCGTAFGSLGQLQPCAAVQS